MTLLWVLAQDGIQVPCEIVPLCHVYPKVVGYANLMDYSGSTV